MTDSNKNSSQFDWFCKYRIGDMWMLNIGLLKMSVQCASRNFKTLWKFLATLE